MPFFQDLLNRFKQPQQDLISPIPSATGDPRGNATGNLYQGPISQNQDANVFRLFGGDQRGGSVLGADTIAPTGGGGGFSGGGGSSSNTSGIDANSNFNSLLNSQISLARSAADEGRRRAGSAFDRARGIYDEGIGLLGKRRGQFQDIFDTGSSDILDRYEGERGNLQASAQGAETRSANALRALGLGGSAAIKSQGRQRQQQARAAGNLSSERSANDRENLRGFNTNQEFANAQESSLNRFLADAQESRTAAENQSGLIERGDIGSISQNVSGYLSNILSQQQALQAANQTTGNFAANPYAVNISDLTGSLNAVLPQLTGGANPNSGVSIDNNATLALNALDPRKRSGVAGAGLFA